MDFNLYTANLDGKKLIEASAGTGKTFTLSGLYVRYIVEKKRTPEQILVLTFTKAATFELKTRLREQLIECKNHLSGLKAVSQTDTPQLFDLYQSYKDDDASLKYVELALACFDQAAIFTINSFCQKIIVDYNKACGSPVFSELIDKGEFVEKFVLDFWREQQNKIPSLYLTKIPNLESVSQKLSGLLSKKHYRDIVPQYSLADVPALDDLYKKICKTWEKDKEELLDYLFSGSFDGRLYKVNSRETYNQALSEFLPSFTLPKPNYIERFTLDFIENKRKEESPTTMPDFFNDFGKFYDKLQEFPLVYLYECWQFVQTGLATLLTGQGLYGYDDQITIVHQAVNSNPKLQELIAKQWQTVMVDEFQDTDLLQLEIFERCFDDGLHDIIYVGDPKQAIYDFRGADVFVYEQAKQAVDASQRFNLATNWRSGEQMLATSNTMFDFENSFKLDWLKFNPSKPKLKQDAHLVDSYPPVAVINCPKEQRKYQLAQELKGFMANAHLVKDGIEEKITEKNIAILVKSNAQAIELYDYLLSQNINVSLWTEAGVYTTEVAQQLYYLIRAIAYPSQKNIFTCLHGLFFNVSLNDLQEADKEKMVAEFINYRLHSAKQDLSSVIDELFKDKGVFAHLLQRLDGERLYTDTMHLLQLIQQQVDLGKNENQISQFLAKEIKNAQILEQDETAKRRLESDGHKIAIMTMHKSKGLEFDCVFIPYADLVKDKPPGREVVLKSIVATHDKDNKGVIYWRQSDQALESLAMEYSAETVRTLYVAITRAKYRVYLGVDCKDKNFSETPIAKLYDKIANNEKLSAIVIPQETEIMSHQQSESPVLCLNKFNRMINKPLSVYSFSSLSRMQEISFESLDEKAAVGEFENYFYFPRGATSGTMQHSILENINFTDDKDTISQEIKKQLEIYQFNSQWQACLTQQMHTIVNTQLWKDGPRLSKVDNTLDEMEFLLPLKSIKNKTIAQWLSKHRNQQVLFKQDDLQGFLTGFIDLVFEHDNKFYVVDYKSNTLGFSYEDYTTKDLKEAIEHHFYDLQYLLYCVALVKYLKVINPSFDYDRDFGGVAYMFTRGVNGEAGQGVYCNKPDENLIEEMVEAFDAR
jgi:exodeoxyribonuclease V beta subunit